MEREHRASTGGCRARGRWRFPGAGYLRESVRRYDGALRQGGPTPASGISVTHSLPLPIPPCGGRLSRTAATIASVDVEFASLMFAVIAVGFALAMQRRADMKLINSRFDDTNRRIDALESRQREDGAQLVALGKDVAKLVGRVDEVAGMVSAAFQTVLGIVVTRPGGKERAPSVMEQAAFTEPGAGED